MAQMNSYLGLMAHADTMRLRRHLVAPLTAGGQVYTRYDLDAVYERPFGF